MSSYKDGKQYYDISSIFLQDNNNFNLIAALILPFVMRFICDPEGSYDL